MSEKKMSFELALKEMEQIITKLEGDEVSLTDALEWFERGVKLMRICDTHLKSAEGKLKEIYKGENGEFIEKILGSTLDSPNEEECLNDRL